MNNAIDARVHGLYWEQDINCARTTLICLCESFDFPLEQQTLSAAIGLHGAGGYRAQCGLVEGALMFIGAYFKNKGLSDGEISELCFRYAQSFEERFGSLRCLELRPDGFSENDAPHKCEPLTCSAVAFAIDTITDYAEQQII